MKHGDLFPIGAVAKLYHISVGTLRHYEKCGLVTPEYIDPDSGYRYYSARQFEQLNMIRYLRMLDFSLSEIENFLHSRDVDSIEEQLRRQKAAVAERRRELARIETMLDRRLQQLHDARHSEREVICERTLPACCMLRRTDTLRLYEPSDMELPIQRLVKGRNRDMVFLGKVGIGISEERLKAGEFSQYDSLFLLLDEGEAADGDTEEWPEMPCVSVRFCGHHRQSPAWYEKLCAYIREHDLEISGFSREITLIDQGFTDDLSQYVTEISIPVRRRESPTK